MNSYPSFFDLADQITDRKQFNDIVSRQQKIFQINPYKIEKLYSETAKKLYSLILSKYEVTKEFKLLENAWQQNQRRVFVWYMIVLIDTQSLNPQRTNQINWDKLCDIFFGKSSSFLEFQFANILKSKSKIIWNQEEDKILLEAMSKQKLGKWNQVSKRIFYESECLLFKSPKHCRQRWYNHLDQTKNKGSWTLQEDYTIFKFLIQNGKRWACIVKQLSNSRTQHMIKNRYNSLISKIKKNKKRRQEEIAQLVYKNLEAEVKMERREKKLRIEQNLCQLKKTQLVQSSFQQQIIEKSQKSYVSDQEKSDHTTLKNVQIKLEEQLKIDDYAQIQNADHISQGNANENAYIPNNFLNFYNFGQQFMRMQGYPMFYFCHPSAFSPLDSMYSYEIGRKIQNQ